MKSNYQMVKTNHDKAQLIYTDHNNHLQLAQAPYKLSLSLPPTPPPPKLVHFTLNLGLNLLSLFYPQEKKYVHLFQCAFLKIFQ